MLTWAGRKLWAHDKTSGEVVGYSPEDGREAARVSIPWRIKIMGQIDDELAVIRVERDTTGEETETLWIVDPAGRESLRQEPLSKWHFSDGPWYVEDFYGGPKVVAKHGEPADGGEAPFGQDTTGITLAGEDLWALDNKSKRICVIEKSAS